MLYTSCHPEITNTHPIPIQSTHWKHNGATSSSDGVFCFINDFSPTKIDFITGWIVWCVCWGCPTKNMDWWKDCCKWRSNLLPNLTYWREGQNLILLEEEYFQFFSCWAGCYTCFHFVEVGDGGATFCSSQHFAFTHESQIKIKLLTTFSLCSSEMLPIFASLLGSKLFNVVQMKWTNHWPRSIS